MIYRCKKFIYCGGWKIRQGDRPYGDVFATFERSPFGFGNWIVCTDGEQRSDLAKFLEKNGKKLWSKA